MIKVSVPASSANLGAGFDALGVALTLYNHIWMEEADGCIIESADELDIPTDETNLVYQAAKTLYDYCGKPFRGLYIKQESNIPMTRGLGSSSACLIGGLLGANTLIGSPLSRAELCNLATKMEGHPDNVAPALLGGLVTSVVEQDQVYTTSLPVSPEIAFAVFIPDFALSTEKARAVLPETVSREDAIYNLSRAALMTASLCTGKLGNLRVAVQDRLHQPYRKHFIPELDTIFDIAYGAGAYAAAISGAGPSILAIIDRDDRSFIDKAEKLLAQHGITNWHMARFHCDPVGATVSAG